MNLILEFLCGFLIGSSGSMAFLILVFGFQPCDAEAFRVCFRSWFKKKQNDEKVYEKY
jgi:hypothetical protein